MSNEIPGNFEFLNLPVSELHELMTRAISEYTLMYHNFETNEDLETKKEEIKKIAFAIITAKSRDKANPENEFP